MMIDARAGVTPMDGSSLTTSAVPVRLFWLRTNVKEMPVVMACMKRMS